MGSRKLVQAPPFFVLFQHWGTPGHPHGPQSLQKRSQEAPKPQFCLFLAPIFSHVCYNLHMLFTHFKGIPKFRSTGRQPTRQKGIPKFRATGLHSKRAFLSSGPQADNLHSKRAFLSSGQQANNLHSKRAFLSSGQQANNLTAKASFAYRDQSTKLQPQCKQSPARWRDCPQGNWIQKG